MGKNVMNYRSHYAVAYIVDARAKAGQATGYSCSTHTHVHLHMDISIIFKICTSYSVRKISILAIAMINLLIGVRTIQTDTGFSCALIPD